uniref:Uncharacterized protein n=1 Tax=Zea mays TaxID=4577 RepID=A0A804Q057_MAIZE
MLLVVDLDVEEVDGALAERERIPEPVAEGLGLEPPVNRGPVLAHQLLRGLQVLVRLRLVEEHERHPLPAAGDHAVRGRPEHRVAHDLHLLADDDEQLVAGEHGHVHPPAGARPPEQHLEAADVAVEEEHGDDGVVRVGLQPVHEVRARAGRVVGEPRVRAALLAHVPEEEPLAEPQHPRHGPEHAPGHLLAAQGVLVQEPHERRRPRGPELHPPLLLRLHRQVQPVAPVQHLTVGVHAVDAVTLGLELAGVVPVGVLQLLRRWQVEELQPGVPDAVQQGYRHAVAGHLEEAPGFERRPELAGLLHVTGVGKTLTSTVGKANSGAATSPVGRSSSLSTYRLGSAGRPAAATSCTICP